MEGEAPPWLLPLPLRRGYTRDEGKEHSALAGKEVGAASQPCLTQSSSLRGELQL